LRPIGRGGTATVYAAIDTLRRRRVALKLSHAAAGPPWPDGERLLVGFRWHRHLVTVHEAGAGYVAMELVPGQSAQWGVGRGRLAWRTATRILAATCAGAAALHAGGLLHRDIKPANLLLGASGAVKLADFGLTCRSGAVPRASDVGFAGTPHFMSPEQCREEPCDERSDVYALGATYFALLTGQPPYHEELSAHVLFDHCSAIIPDVLALRTDIPPACGEVIRRAMAKRRADRFTGAGTMQACLERLLASPARLGRARTWVS
jgi:urea transport system substrate-binding protein